MSRSVRGRNTKPLLRVFSYVKPRPIAVAFLLATVASICASCASHATASRQSARPHANVTDVGGAGTIAAGPAPADTRARTFDPYDASGTLTVNVARQASGVCWTTSVAAAGSAAFRCRAGNAILDPCFAASATATSVACLADPWSAAVVVRIAGALPTDPPMGDSIRPWAIELAGGVRCVASTGTVPMIAGVSLDYVCQDGTSASVQNPLQKNVTALAGRPGAAALAHVRVATVWRG